MSSSPVSQLLQITAPRAETKLQQASSSPEGQFQDLLARASSSVEGQPKQGTETPPVQQSDEPLKDNNLEQDASPQYDEAATNSDAPSDAPADAATETLELQEDNQPDVIELSEAAELVLGAQGVPEEILSIEVTTEPDIEASVIDAPSLENYVNQSKSESQASTEQVVKTIDVNLPVNQYDQFTEEEAGAIEQAAFVETSEGDDAPAQEGQQLPASELIADSDGEPANKDFSARLESEADRPTEEPAHAIAVKEHSKPATAQKLATETLPAQAEGSVAVAAEGSVAVAAEGSVAVAAEGSVAVAAEGSVAAEAEDPEESNDRETPSHEPKVARDRESAPDKTDTTVETWETVGTEENVNAAKDASPVQSSLSSPAVVNPASGEATAATSHSPASSTGEGSAVNADSDPVPTTDRARFVHRVSRAFQSAQAGKGEIQLRLSPPELGSLRISITVHEGVVSAKVEAETAAARNVLLDNLPALRERLAEQEIRIEKFDVDVRRDGGQETGNSGPNDRQTRQTRADSAPSLREREPGHLETTPSPRRVHPINTVADGGLDVRI